MSATSLPLRNTTQERVIEKAASGWCTLYRIGAAAALTLVLFTFVQAAIYIIWPPPSFEPAAGAVRDWFSLLQNNWLIGLLDLDLMMLVDYPLNLLVVFALYAALRRTNQSLAAVAAALGLMGLASYFAANPAFSMLALSRQYAAAGTQAEQATTVAAGQAIMAVFAGSAFNTSYVLIAVSGLIMSLVMLWNNTFSRRTAYVGIVFYAMNLVPASAGTLGLVLSLASLLPMVIWLVMIARRFLQISREMEAK